MHHTLREASRSRLGPSRLQGFCRLRRGAATETNPAPPLVPNAKRVPACRGKCTPTRMLQERNLLLSIVRLACCREKSGHVSETELESAGSKHTVAAHTYPTRAESGPRDRRHECATGGAIALRHTRMSLRKEPTHIPHTRSGHIPTQTIHVPVRTSTLDTPILSAGSPKHSRTSLPHAPSPDHPPYGTGTSLGESTHKRKPQNRGPTKLS